MSATMLGPMFTPRHANKATVSFTVNVAHDPAVRVFTARIDAGAQQFEATHANRSYAITEVERLADEAVRTGKLQPGMF